MKKTLLMMLLSAGIPASVLAQQLANGTFDQAWVYCYPWEKGAQVTTDRGTQPEGWCMANVNGISGMGATIIGSTGTDRTNAEGGFSAVVTNTANPYRSSEIVPGYMSLGTTWATAKATITSITPGTADGGVFGGISFTHRPDALKLYYKRAHNVGNKSGNTVKTNERASIIAYAWKGTWTQADVPSNTSMGNPTKVTMTDRSNNILGKECITGGTVTKSADAELISVIEHYITGDVADWTELILPFEYQNTEDAPEKLNIIFSANDMFADRSGIGVGNQLTVDDVSLLYYNTLESIKIDGEEILAGDQTEYTVHQEYDAAKLVLTAKSLFATATPQYDDATGVLTITVQRENADNKVYTIQYDLPVTNITCSSIKYNGIELLEEGKTSYTAAALYDESLLAIDATPAETAISKDYNTITGLLTVTLSHDGMDDLVYTIQFNPIPAGLASLSYNNQSLLQAGTYQYNVNACYDETLLAYAAHENSGDEVSKSFDETTWTATIKVKRTCGEQTDEQTYTINFLPQPIALGTLSYDGESLLQEGVKEYTVNAVYNAEKLTFAPVHSSDQTDTDYDNTTGDLTITISRQGADDVTYTIHFDLPTVTIECSSLTYNGTELLDGEGTTFDVNAMYDPQLLAYTITPAATTVNKAYDRVTGTLTLTLSCDKADNVTYTINFVPVPIGLATLSYDQESILGTGLESEVSARYEADKVEYTLIDLDDTAASAYDRATGVLTITVSREGATEPTVYTVQFEPVPVALSSLKFGETELLDGEETALTAEGRYDASAVTYTAEDELDTVAAEYDDKTCVLTVTVSREGCDDKAYTVQFDVPFGLTSLSYDEVALLEDGKTEYTVEARYDADKLAYDIEDTYAQASAEYDRATGILTLTLSREYTDDKVYTIQFEAVPVALSSLKFDETELLEGEEVNYNVNAPYDEALVAYTAEDELDTVSAEYEQETGILTITVSREGCDDKVYTVTFSTIPEGIGSITANGTAAAYDLAGRPAKADARGISIQAGGKKLLNK